MDKRLIELARDIRVMEQKIYELKKAFILKRLFLLSSARNKLEYLLLDFDKEMRKWLLQNNEEFKQLAQENLKLLEHPKIIYKTKTFQYNPIGTYSAYFQGKMFPNGYGQLELRKTNLGFYPLSKYDYVSKFLGNIDYLGDIELKPIQISSSFAFSRPRLYHGYVNDKGMMVLTVSKRDIELITGHVVVGGMIGLHLDESEKRKKFFDNRQRLINIIEQTKKQLLENQQTK